MVLSEIAVRREAIARVRQIRAHSPTVSFAVILHGPANRAGYFFVKAPPSGNE